MAEEEQLPGETTNTCRMNLNKSRGSLETLVKEREVDVTKRPSTSSLSVTQRVQVLALGPCLLCRRSTRKATGFSHSVS